MSEERAIPRPFIAHSKLERVLLLVAIGLVTFDVIGWVGALAR